MCGRVIPYCVGGRLHQEVYGKQNKQCLLFWLARPTPPHSHAHTYTHTHTQAVIPQTLRTFFWEMKRKKRKEKCSSKTGVRVCECGLPYHVRTHYYNNTMSAIAIIMLTLLTLKKWENGRFVPMQKLCILIVPPLPHM